MDLKSQRGWGWGGVGGGLLRGVFTAPRDTSSPKIRRHFSSEPQALPWWKVGQKSEGMSNEEKFAGFKEQHLVGVGPKSSAEALVGGFTSLKPIHFSLVLGTLGHLFLLNSGRRERARDRPAVWTPESQRQKQPGAPA